MDKTKVKGYIGIVMLILMFVGFFAWETYGRDALMYTNIVAFNEPVIKGDIISEENIKIMSVEQGTIANSLRNQAEVVGKVALVDIPENMPISENYLENVEETTVGDEFIFAIPSSWIYGIPQSIRAKDTAYFYEVKEGKEIDGLTVSGNDRKKVEKEADYVFSANIKYVKDGSNREVVNVSRGSRDDGSSGVSNIEIIGTQKDLDTLEKKASSGSKFIIMYKE